jgi:hypothetical protein
VTRDAGLVRRSGPRWGEPAALNRRTRDRPADRGPVTP